MPKPLLYCLLLAALAGPLAAGAQEDTPAQPDDPAAETGNPSQGYEDFEPTEEISEDLSVAFPTDI